MKLAERVAIVTGAGSRRGIGRATALALAREGATVAVVDLNPEGARAVAQEVEALGRRALPLGVDVTDEEQVNGMARTVADTFGRVDILVNCAGITLPTPVLEISSQEWDLMLNVDLKSVFLCTRAVLPAMQRQHYGRVISISSIAGKQGGGLMGSAHYCAAKAGVAGFTRAVAKQMASFGITANAVAPGPTDTDLTIGLVQTEEQMAARELAYRSIPAGRKAKADEIAAAILFLASEEAGYITGEELDVNGGLYMD